jgi:antitoxin component YwqK of YwqJK toxin-antitoxin module
VITKDELVIDKGIAYQANDYKPFTGKHSTDHPYKKKNDVIGATGKKEPDSTKSETKTYIEVNYTDGKKNGPSIIWDEYGRKVGQLNYKNGKRID